MSKLFPRYYGMVGGLYPVLKEGIVVGGDVDYQKTMDLGVEFESFIRDTTKKLSDISVENLASVGIKIEKDHHLNTIDLELKVGGAEYRMSAPWQEDKNNSSKVTATQHGVVSSLLGGAITCLNRVFDFKNESSLIVGDAFERCFSFSTEETSYQQGTRRVTGSYLGANALHPNTHVVFSKDKGGYVVERKSKEFCPRFKDNKFIESNGTDWQQPLFCCTTYKGGFDEALADADLIVRNFEQAWFDALVKLGLEAPKSSLSRCLESNC